MKFLTVPRLQRLSSLLQHVDLGSQILHARVEAYSCKAAGDDKRLGKQLERQISEELAHSPTMSPTMSPLGPLTDANTRKLLISLITTMNASFPDYDFSNLRADQFERELAPAVAIASLNSLFLDSLELTQPGIRAEFWQAINETVELSACELYTFTPHPDSELDEGKLWSVRQFFYHRKEKKVLFVAASAVSKLHDDEDDGDEEDVDVVMSSSGGEAGAWDEGEVESNILWDDLEFGEGALGVFSDESHGGQRLSEHPQTAKVREVTDALPIAGSSGGARRRSKLKREAIDDEAAGKVSEEEKKKRRKKRTTAPKAAREEAGKKGKRAPREGKKDSGGLLGVTAAAGSDDEVATGGRSLLDPKRSPSPAAGLLPLATLVDAKEPAAAEAAQ